MEWYEILVIVVAVLFVAFIVGMRLYKLAHHIPLDECESCGKKGKNLIKYYRKQKRKESKCKDNCCCSR